jgi:hypothetical protein
MFAINKGIICNIIKKAREIDITEDLLPQEEPDALSDMEWKQLLVEYQDDLSYVELCDLINDLEPDQQQDVIALMYIGRGDFEKEEWQLAYKQARTIPVKNRANYLISKNMLSDYLNEGLAKFNHSCEE